MPNFNRLSAAVALILICAQPLQLRAQSPSAQDSSSTAKGSEFDVSLASTSVKFLETYCQRCHGVDQRYPGLDVLDRATLLDPKVEDEDAFLVPGNAENSRLWDVIDSEHMPPASQSQPTDEEKAAFRRWIEAGGQFPPEARVEREYLGESTILKFIDDDLRKLTREQVANTRYFSLAHLWNDVSGSDPTTEQDLRLARAGLSKLLNSLSSMPRIALPRIVDSEYETILAIDIRDYGWDSWHWNQVQAVYPYALKLNGQTASRIYEQTGTPVPYVRADWFLAFASRPPLYHLLLEIPKNAKTLESNLGVDVARNFASGRLARAAFQKSGVSQQNRMVERHDAPKGGRYYWKSYDIKPGTAEEGDFSRRPLGPKFDGVLSQQAVFKHDGGEIIWSLPNGLQGYMLVTGNDERINEGPPDVVFDPNSHGGSFLITNGISCMGCHRQGMIAWEKDEIRSLFEPKQGQKVADKVLQLFPKNGEMQSLVKADKSFFAAALQQTISPFLNVGDAKNLSITDFAEPITKSSNRYLQNVTLEKASQELGLEDPADLRALLKLNQFRQLGLSNWTNDDGVVSRDNWEKAYRRLARELGRGTPVY
ncbi:MAG TPA: hypothetical protein DDW52_21945 [Planctomycetaceae bacterium]|nr:hypothetical protein [Planctomycetaceae bacterium]